MLLARVFGIDERELFAAREDEITAVPLPHGDGGPVDLDYVEGIRQASQVLVKLDGR